MLALQLLKVNLNQMNGICNMNDFLTRNATLTVGDLHFDLHCVKIFTPGLPAYDAIARKGVANGTIKDIISVTSSSYQTASQLVRP